MANVEQIKVGDYWLDYDGKPRLVTIILSPGEHADIFTSYMPDKSLDLFISRQIKPELLIRKIEKAEAIRLFIEEIQKKIQDINKVLKLDLKVTFTAEQESAVDKGGT